jgi:hypothetical protein
MTLQEQLGQPQKPAEFPLTPMVQGGFGASLLGNQSSQTSSQESDKGAISSVGLLVGNYDRLIQDAASATVASGVVLNAGVASVGGFIGFIVNEPTSALTYSGLVVNAAMPAVVGSQRRGENAVVANAESVEMSWLVQNAQEFERYRGEWLLIRGQQLLVHSPNFADVRTLVRERQINSPFVYYVPTEEESNAVTI